SFAVQPYLSRNFAQRPWLWIFPVVAAAGLFGLRMCLGAGLDLWAFVCSGVFILGLLCSAAFGLYPNVLPAVPDPGLNLTIHNVAASPYGLRIGLLWWLPAFALAVGYSVLVYRHFRGKVRVDESGEKPTALAAH
ncbi:MAG TPA: cytochrome d ubiquinol oxidase subunit II, partial [Bryobacteraceae bacterium]|nr:cytochrome d ubiquinol oxidase subunit II [Bryobacteraceae bacterium]